MSGADCPIPVVDFSAWAHGGRPSDGPRAQRFAEDLLHSMATYGCAILRNHTITTQRVNTPG